MTSKPIAVGDRVQLTSKFLRNTGQYTGGEAQSVWTVTGFCHDGRWAITDELQTVSLFTDYELAADPTLKFRRIAVANIKHV